MFRLICPKCGVEPEDAKLEVVSGSFRASKMWLQEDGFATTDAKSFDTDEETVYCHACERFFPLGDCLDDSPAPLFDPFKGFDWTELAGRFGVVIPNDDDAEPLVVYIESHLAWEPERICQICREFLDAIVATDPTHNKSVWEGLTKVKDDETFMRFFIHMLDWMWT